MNHRNHAGIRGEFISPTSRLRGVCFVVLVLAATNCAIAQPWHYNVLWDQVGASDSSQFGTAFLSLGDQNDDGFADWAVLAYGFGQPIKSYMEFFHGDQDSVGQLYMHMVCNSLPTSFLRNTSVVGDVNGDGYPDWYIWSRLAGDPAVEQLRVFFGGPAADSIADLTIVSPVGEFSSIGDYNGDGSDDIYLWDGNGRLFYGGVNVDSTADLVLPNIPPGDCCPAKILSHGDLDGTGASDGISRNIEGPWQDEALLFWRGGIQPDTTPAFSWPNFYVTSQDIVNDMNGDGKDELAVSHDGTRLELHLGRTPELLRTPDYLLQFELAGRCASLGDVNRDGFGDIAALDWQHMHLAVYLGGSWVGPAPAFSVSSGGAPLHLVGLSSFIGLGDVNGDGVGDIGIGSTLDEFDGRRGRAIVLSGDSSYHVAVVNQTVRIPDVLSLELYPNPVNGVVHLSVETLPFTNTATLSIFNLLGQTVHQQLLPVRGSHAEISLSTSDLEMSTGVYLVVIQASELREIQKLVVLK